MTVAAIRSLSADQPSEKAPTRDGFQQTDLGLIPDDWQILPLDRTCRLVNGRGFKPFEWNTSGLPIIRIQNLNGSDEFNYYDGPYNKKIEIQTGQLLFAWSGSRGTSFGPHFWNGPLGLLNYHTWKIEANDNVVLARFLYHKLKQLTSEIESWAHGASALVHVQKWQMEGFQIAIPICRKEQCAIAEALSDADALIASLDALISKKRDLKQAAMQQLLTGKTRLPGFKGGWEEKSIDQLCRVDPDNLGANTPCTFSFNYISLENVESGRLVGFTEMEFGNAPSRARRRLQPGDLLVSTVRPNLKAHLLFQNTSGDWVCSTGFSVLRPIHCQSNSQFLFQHFFDRIINDQIDKLIAGSNYPAISSRDVKSLKLTVPRVEEQEAIASVLSDMHAEIAALEAKRDKARTVKQGMMQELLTGRIRLV